MQAAIALQVREPQVKELIAKVQAEHKTKGLGVQTLKLTLVQIRVVAIATASLKTAPWATPLLMHLLKQKSKQ
jgi:hypothetical protein